MSAHNCDYYKARSPNSQVTCPNCYHWAGARCGIEAKVKQNSKTELVHETFPASGRSRRVTRMLR